MLRPVETLVSARDGVLGGEPVTKGQELDVKWAKHRAINYLLSKRLVIPRPDPSARTTKETTPTPTSLSPGARDITPPAPPIVNDKPITLSWASGGGLGGTLTANPLAWSPTGYDWDAGDGSTMHTTAPNWAHIYAADGTYTASVVATDAAGNSGTATTDVTVTSATREGQNATSQAGPAPGGGTQPNRNPGSPGHPKRKH